MIRIAEKMKTKNSSKKIRISTKTDIHHIVAQNIRRLRHEKGWSQEKLAKEAGIHRVYVGRVERCEQTISLATLEKIANALDTAVKDLF